MRVTKVHTIISILSFAALAICLVVRDGYWRIEYLVIPQFHLELAI